MATKKCSKCEQKLPATAFHKNRRRPDGLAYWCRACTNSTNTQRRLAAPIRHREQCAEWRRKHPKAVSRFLRKARLRRYGLTIEDYDQLLAAQEHKCAICGRPPEAKQLDVDHDHATGTVRGLLCNRCNRGLGYFQDTPDTLRQAAKYLEAVRP